MWSIIGLMVLVVGLGAGTDFTSCKTRFGLGNGLKYGFGS
ncbi:MAG: hypothetical protein G01um101416_492 [Microgenomates group bacterium Gr01-1014_16]|nr:MAG: hypothetical protein G01um101416_492 [Microgenomates group bacterium Gr01-1014_16]